MKSPQGLTFIVALVFAIIVYFVASAIELTSIAVAIIAFIVAFIAPLVGRQSATNEEAPTKQQIKTLYVGNLPYRANEAAVRELFSEHGQVQSVRLMKDKHTGKRRGFGFVEIAACDADNAITHLNDCEFQQRTLKVREAKERPERSAE